jgi:hypothetical protein
LKNEKDCDGHHGCWDLDQNEMLMLFLSLGMIKLKLKTWRGDEVEKAKVWRITDWQENSAFFNLPLEIRKQIYEEAIGGYTLHIFTLDAYRRMSHTRCKGVSPTSASCQCPLLSRQPGVADEWGNICLLSLVMTCRRM